MKIYILTIKPIFFKNRRSASQKISHAPAILPCALLIFLTPSSSAVSPMPRSKFELVDCLESLYDHMEVELAEFSAMYNDIPSVPKNSSGIEIIRILNDIGKLQETVKRLTEYYKRPIDQMDQGSIFMKPSLPDTEVHSPTSSDDDATSQSESE